MSEICVTISPNTGAPLAEWEALDAAALGARLKRLRGAVLDDPSARGELLSRAVATMRKAADDLTDAVVTEVAKTPEEASAELDYALSFLEYGAHLVGEHHFVHRPGPGRQVREVGAGVALLICPFNDPIAGITRKIAPALAAGCPALVKPSGLGAQTASVLEAALAAAGLSEAVQFIPTRDNAAVGALIGDPAVGIVSFTGSTAVGRQLAASSAAALTPFVGELGGINPFVVFSDADLDRAARDIVARKTRAAGQACSSLNHVHAEAPVCAELTERLVARFEQVRAGRSADEDVEMGPVRTAQAVSSLARMAARIAGDGGRCVAGGVTEARDGAPFVVRPTLYAVDQPGIMEAEEAFGPLLTISEFSDRTALQGRLAQNTQPLVLYIYSGDSEAAHAFAMPLRYGSVGINSTAIQAADVPTGGFRDAGIGREGGAWGFSEFLTTINIRDGASGG